MMVQALRGTADLLCPDISRFISVEETAKRTAFAYGYQEIRTPIIEESGLFLRSVGETTDIIQKEMFRFEDRGGHDIVLRPEGTASIVRAYLEHNLHKTEGFSKLFYMGPMFRAERPQAGRFRQFHQFGVEAIGSGSPFVDAEAISLCLEIIWGCGLTSENTSLWISSMGCRADQAKSAEVLRNKLAVHKEKLCKECLSRFEKNIFRVLDCKNPHCHEIAWKEAGASPFILCDECKAHFDQVRGSLKSLGISFEDDKVFARGLDYYTRTVFEVRSKGLGAQDAVAAGGRYDHLVEELGGPSVGAFGFAAGIERLLIAIGNSSPAKETPEARRGLYLAVAKPELISEGLLLSSKLRKTGGRVFMDLDGKSLKSQFREADKSACKFVAVLGDNEIKSGTIALKNLEDGSQENISLADFVGQVAKRLANA